MNSPKFYREAIAEACESSREIDKKIEPLVKQQRLIYEHIEQLITQKWKVWTPDLDNDVEAFIELSHDAFANPEAHQVQEAWLRKIHSSIKFAGVHSETGLPFPQITLAYKQEIDKNLVSAVLKVTRILLNAGARSIDESYHGINSVTWSVFDNGLSRNGSHYLEVQQDGKSWTSESSYDSPEDEDILPLEDNLEWIVKNWWYGEPYPRGDDW